MRSKLGDLATTSKMGNGKEAGIMEKENFEQASCRHHKGQQGYLRAMVITDRSTLLLNFCLLAYLLTLGAY
jgi:hypothetical protein